MSEPQTHDFVAETSPPTSAAASDAARRRDTAWRHPCAQLRFWLVAIVGLGADLYSKQWAFGALQQGGGRELIPHVLQLRTMLNEGALFGIGQGQTTLFLGASVFALALVFWMFARSSPKRWMFHIALGALLAGAVGNMYDRTFVQLYAYPVGGATGYFEKAEDDGATALLKLYPSTAPRGLTRRVPSNDAQLRGPVGCVRDFIKIPTKVPWLERELWPWVFNVADMLLVGGAAYLALHLWRDREPGGRPRSKRVDASQTAA